MLSIKEFYFIYLKAFKADDKKQLEILKIENPKLFKACERVDDWS